jgi:hypothetical protein
MMIGTTEVDATGYLTNDSISGWLTNSEIAYVGMDFVHHRLGCMNLQCTNQLTINSSMMNSSASVDMNQGLNNHLAIGTPVVGLFDVQSSIEVYSSGEMGNSCYGVMSIDNKNGTVTTIGVMTTTDITDVAPNWLSYASIMQHHNPTQQKWQ